MVRTQRIAVLGALAAATLVGQARLSVTVFDQKTAEPIGELTAANFAVTDGSTPLRVDAASYKQELLDVLLLVDSSMVGQSVRPLAGPLVEALGPKEQMAIIGFDQSASLLQDFTAGKEYLHRALNQIEYGNNPRILDALFAALDGGFEGGAGRRVALVLSSGAEARSRTPLADVVALARRREASIFVAYAEGFDAGLLAKLASQAGGAWFDVKKLKLSPDELAARIFKSLRGRYELEVSGVATLGDRIEVEIIGLPKSKQKIAVGVLAPE